MSRNEDLDSQSSADKPEHAPLSSEPVDGSHHKPAKRRSPSALMPLIKSQRMRVTKHGYILDTLRECASDSHGEMRIYFEDALKRARFEHDGMLKKLNDLLTEMDWRN